jgi:hypothetical protein
MWFPQPLQVGEEWEPKEVFVVRKRSPSSLDLLLNVLPPQRWNVIFLNQRRPWKLKRAPDLEI